MNKSVIKDSWFSEPQSKELDHLRQEARKTRRLPYDCFNAVIFNNDRVKCRKGHPLSANGKDKEKSMFLASVLRGRSSGYCWECPDYDTEEPFE